MAEADAHPQLAGNLEQLVAIGRRRLRPVAARDAAESACRWLCAAALPVPCLALGANLLGLLGWSVWPLGVAATVVVAVLAPLAIVAAAALGHFLRRGIDAQACLALYDGELRLKGRLQAAHEFLGKATPSAFEQAAIDDAATFAATALNAPQRRVRPNAPVLRPGPWPLALAAGIALLAATLLGGGLFGTVLVDGPDAEAALADAAANDAPLGGDENEPSVAKQALRQVEEGALLAAAGAAAPESRHGDPLRTATAAGTARASASNSAASASASQQSGRSVAGASAEGSAQPSPAKPPAAERRPPAPQKPGERPAEPPETSQGVSGGSGRSSGSRTSASDRPAPDDKSANDEAQGDATDDAEDEQDEEQQGATTRRPMLNNRKASVDRSLSPSGISDQENPDANGRSGAGGLKKTRGVAAMLLGVPMPDHLRGMSNPGRVKVQRERADPEPKTAPPAEAGRRPARASSIGYLPHPVHAPWMKDTIRTYFLAERRSDRVAPSGEPPLQPPEGTP